MTQQLLWEQDSWDEELLGDYPFLPPELPMSPPYTEEGNYDMDVEDGNDHC